MRVLFLFLDGVGLGSSDPQTNPLARAAMPHMVRLLGGRRLLADTAPLEAERATLVALDACLGVPGKPQSASGQASLLTGLNIPAMIGMHYGPWPNPAITALLSEGNLFRSARRAGRRAVLLNAYPPSYFTAIRSGRRMYSAVPRAATSAEVALMTQADLNAGRALSADLTGEGWRDRLGLPDTPLLSAREAGGRMAALSKAHDFSFFEFWLSDYAGHRQSMPEAIELLSQLDEMLAGLLDAWDDQGGMALITSDHGNLEDLATRGHTTNAVPALIIGSQNHRRQMAASLRSLTDVAPAILAALA